MLLLYRFCVMYKTSLVSIFSETMKFPQPTLRQWITNQRHTNPQWCMWFNDGAVCHGGRSHKMDTSWIPMILLKDMNMYYLYVLRNFHYVCFNPSRLSVLWSYILVDFFCWVPRQKLPKNPNTTWFNGSQRSFCLSHW